MHSSISSFHSPSFSLIIIFLIQSCVFFTLFFYSIPLHSNTKRPVEPAIGLVCKVGIKPLFHYVKLSTYVCHTMACKGWKLLEYQLTCIYSYIYTVHIQFIHCIYVYSNNANSFFNLFTHEIKRISWFLYSIYSTKPTRPPLPPPPMH